MNQEFLKSSYNFDSFREFLDSFLPDFKEDVQPVHTINTSSKVNVRKLGESKELELTVYEIDHESTNDRRVGLALEGFRVMKDKSVYNALIVYRTKKSGTWRLSLMTTSHELRNGKVVNAFSNPRRYSYVLGEGTKTATPHKFLISKKTVVDIDDLLSRFSVEVVNNEFYKEIAKLYDELVGVDDVVGILKHPDRGEATHQFAVRLIGRVVFCWFLREKYSSNGIPLINKNILSRKAGESKDYYHTVLAPLFFEVLNKPIEERVDKFKNGDFGEVPYLNGGLFADQEGDHYDFDETTEQSLKGSVDVPDVWLIKLLELLELYNFTVDENTSVDIDLSIDPEMLGRIFENLLARINPETKKTVRQATGSFYTPREVVEFMVDEALVGYLAGSTDIEEKYLKALVSFNLEDDKKFPLEQKQKDQIVKSLSTLKILDPACGSGAYPIAILQKVVFVLQQIDPEAQRWFESQISDTTPEVRQLLQREFENKNFDYIRKLGVIRESIFGIDVQPIATEIARLRCFLTLIVDERVQDDELNRGVYPLPNLDFKFVTANSLVPLGTSLSSKNEQAGLFEDDKGISNLKKLRDDYFNSHNLERDSLKYKFSQTQNMMLQKMIQIRTKDVADTTQRLSSWNPFNNEATEWFDAEWMFGVRSDFDVVLGNPPYGVSVKGDYRKKVENNLGKVPDFEIYYYFIELANKLLKVGGINTYIIPNTFLFNVFAAKYRLTLLEKWEIRLIADCTAFKLFESATVHNAVTVFQKNNFGSTSIGYKSTNSADSFNKLVSQDTLSLPKDLLAENNTNWGLAFKLKREILELVKKIKSTPNTIGELFPEISQGLIAYDKYQGQSEEIIKTRAYHFNEKVKPDLKEWVKGEDVRPYSVKWSGKEYVDYCEGIANPRDPKFFVGNRLLIREITNPKIYAGMTDIELYHDPAIIVILDNENDIKPLLGIMNSKLATYFHFNSSPKASKGAFPKILVKDIKDFPIPDWVNSKKLTSLVSSRLSNLEENSDSNRLLDDEIDRLVYSLYGLSENQIEIIESFFRDR